jgi:WD40 repeat protein
MIKQFSILFIALICTIRVNCQEIKPVKVLNKHSGGVTALAFSPDGKTLVTGSEDKTLLLWNTANWECSKPLTGHSNTINSIAFLKSGTRFYSGGDYYVRSWNMEGKELDSNRGPTTYIWSVAFKADSSQWIAGSFEKNIRLFDYTTGKLSLLQGHSKSALSVAYSPDGKLMASGSLDETILVWNTSNYKPVDTLKGHGGNIFCVTFSPDGKYLASASNDNTVRLWEVSSGKLLRTFRGHTAGVFSVAFSADGNYLVSGSVDTRVMLWEICNGELLATLEFHTQAVNEVAFHPSGDFFVSGALDKTVAVWEFSKELIVMHYFPDSFDQEKEESGLFEPRSKEETKVNYQERQIKAQEFNRQLVEKYYNQYLASIKGVWK